MSDHSSRREALRACLGAAALGLAGCSRSTFRTAGPLPGPRWPDVPIPALNKPETRFSAVPGALRRPSGVRPRSDWTTSSTIERLADPMRFVKRITVHHDGMPPVRLGSASEVRERIALVRRAHVGLGWADIGYHFVIDPMGEVWEARPLVFQGAHVRYNNERNLGIMVLGHFDKQSPTPEATSALDELIVAFMGAHRVTLQRVETHQEIVATACPGKNLQRHMVEARSVRGSIATGSHPRV